MDETTEQIKNYLLKKLRKEFVMDSLFWQSPTIAILAAFATCLNWNIVLAIFVLFFVIELPILIFYTKLHKKLDKAEFDVELVEVEDVKLSPFVSFFYNKSKMVKFSNKKRCIPVDCDINWRPSLNVTYISLGTRKYYYIPSYKLY